MTKVSKPAAAPPIERDEVPSGNALLRDEFAMRAMAAIIGSVVNRGGMSALSLAGTPESLLTTAYEFADSAMRVRVVS